LTGDPCRGEVFCSNGCWRDQLLQDHLGFPFNVEDLHGAEEAGYAWDYLQDNCWDMWLRGPIAVGLRSWRTKPWCREWQSAQSPPEILGWRANITITPPDRPAGGRAE
jgi:hypothetical protein